LQQGTARTQVIRVIIRRILHMLHPVISFCLAARGARPDSGRALRKIFFPRSARSSKEILKVTLITISREWITRLE
jgi:hypothetical protein